MSVIASEAKQSIARHKGKMDCFVASLLAMTLSKHAILPYRSAVHPSCAQNFRPERWRGINRLQYIPTLRPGATPMTDEQLVDMHRFLAAYHRTLARKAVLDVVQQYHSDLAQRLADEAALIPRRTAIAQRLHEGEQRKRDDEA